MSEILEISYLMLKKNLNCMIIDLSTKNSEPHYNVISSSIRFLSYMQIDDLENLIQNANIELTNLNYSIQNKTLTIKKKKP